MSYLTLKELDKVNGKLNLIMFYVHRYIRLTIPLAFITAFYIFALPGVAYLMQSQVYFALFPNKYIYPYPETNI